MRSLLILLLLALGLPLASAQDALKPGTAINSGYATNKWICSTNPIAWRSIMVNNISATDYWILAFNSRTNMVDNNPVQVAAVKIVAGTTGWIDPPNGPIYFPRGLVIHASTTPVTLTNVTAGASNALVFTVFRDP